MPVAPLAQYADTISRFASHTVARLKELDDKAEVFMGGMFSQVRLMNTKKARSLSSPGGRSAEALPVAKGVNDFTMALLP